MEKPGEDIPKNESNPRGFSPKELRALREAILEAFTHKEKNEP